MPSLLSLRRPKESSDDAGEGFPSLDTSMDSSTPYIGVELDGSSCRSVTVRNGKILQWKTYKGETPAEALDLWAKQTKTGGAKIRICWTGPGQKTRALRVHDIPQTVPMQKALIQELAAEHIPDAQAICGRIYPPDSHPDGQLVLIAGVAKDVLIDVWEVIGSAPWEVIPSVMFLQTDGIHLFVHDSCTRVVGVQNQEVLTHVELNCGGLDDLATTLRDPQIAQSMTTDGSNASRPEMAIIQAFLSRIVGETTQWVNSWISNSYIDAPDRLWIHGSGARMPDLAKETLHALTLTGYYTSAEQVFLPLNVADRSGIDDADIPVAWLPVCASVISVPSTAVFDNPVALRAKAREQARRQHFVNISIIALILILIVVGLFTPLYIANKNKDNAQTALNQTIATKSSLHPQYNIYNIVTQGRTAEATVVAQQPAIAQLWPLLASTTPSGGAINSLAVTVAGPTMKMTMGVSIAYAGSNPQNSVADWLNNLTNAGFADANTEAFSYNPTTGLISSSYTFSYTGRPLTDSPHIITIPKG